MARLKGSVDKILGGRKSKPMYFKVNNSRRAYGRPKGAMGKRERDSFRNWFIGHGKDRDISTSLGYQLAMYDYLNWQRNVTLGYKGRQYRSRFRIFLPFMEFSLLEDDRFQLTTFDWLGKRSWHTVTKEEGFKVIREVRILRIRRLRSICRKLRQIGKEIDKLKQPVYVSNYVI